MSDPNGFRAYESAIIGWMLASGDHTLDSIRGEFASIRKTARLFSGGVSDTYYPIGSSWEESHFAQECLWLFLSEPRPLAEVMAHLLALGFSEPVARYAYRYMLDSKNPRGSVLTMTEVDGVPMLQREAKP
jgi:hypothetical protein